MKKLVILLILLVIFSFPVMALSINDLLIKFNNFITGMLITSKAATCYQGLTNNYRCYYCGPPSCNYQLYEYGKWYIQRAYQNTDCSYTWLKIQLCQYGCNNNQCNPAPPTCINECSSGQIRCNGNYKQACGNYNTDTCLEYPLSTTGTGNTLCDYGCENNVCKSAPQLQCNLDIDCPTNYYCSGGICTLSKQPSQSITCVIDEECQPREMCKDGACIEKPQQVSCISDIECQLGFMCINGNCTLEEEQNITCIIDEDCLQGEICSDGECISEIPIFCSTDIDCSIGYICMNGECILNEEQIFTCLIDEDCFSNEICVDSTCVPIEGQEEQQEIEETELGECTGCIYEESCFKTGKQIKIEKATGLLKKKELNYCAEDGKWKSAKKPESSCGENYECSSKKCKDNECTLTFLQKLSNFITNIFG